jgi:hypothetical protein
MTYQHRIRQAIEAGLIVKGEVTHVTVEHQDGCRVWASNRCTCKPILRVLSGTEVATLREDAAPAMAEEAP